jgi:hypothetical protein
MLAFCAQLASYLCLLIYVTKGEKASIDRKGDINKQA